MSANLLGISRQISELIHDEATDFDAPVKIIIPAREVNGGDGDREFTVTDVELVVNEEDDSQVVWLSVVEE